MVLLSLTKLVCPLSTVWIIFIKG